MANTSNQTVNLSIKGLDVNDITKMQQQLENYRNTIISSVNSFSSKVQNQELINNAIKGPATQASYKVAVNTVAEKEKVIIRQLNAFITALDTVKLKYQAGEQNNLSNTFKAVK